MDPRTQLTPSDSNVTENSVSSIGVDPRRSCPLDASRLQTTEREADERKPSSQPCPIRRPRPSSGLIASGDRAWSNDDESQKNHSFCSSAATHAIPPISPSAVAISALNRSDGSLFTQAVI